MKLSARRIAVGAVIGATAGYVAGILTAPKSGKDTRKDIVDKTLKTKHDAEKNLKQLHTELDQLLEKAKAGAKKLHVSAKEDFATVVTGAQMAKEKSRELLSAVHEGGADDKELDGAVKEAKKAIEHLKVYLRKHPAKAS